MQPILAYTTQINFSNITVASINVTVTFFNYDGTVIKDSGSTLFSSNNANSFNGNPTSNKSATFSIDANESAYIVFQATSPYKYGYMLVEWSQDSNAIYGLLANGRYFHSQLATDKEREAMYSIPINAGKPF